MNYRTYRFLLLLAAAISLAACQTMPRHKLHHRMVTAPETLRATPLKLVGLPMSVRVKEMSAGGLREEVGDWSEEAKANIRAAMQSSRGFTDRFELVPLGELSDDEQNVVDEHIALFDVVAGGAMLHTMLPPVDQAWQPKAKHFDYTLGPGLAFLREKTGADKALILFGEDVISTAGRKATAVVAAVFGVVIPMGHSFLIAGLVDLESGDILWIDYSFSPSGKTFRVREDVDALLNELFANYPGIDSYVKGTQTE